MPKKSCIIIYHECDIINARRTGRDFVRRIGFNEIDQARITTAISELARNIYLYANKGKIYFTKVNKQSRLGVCVCAVDQGPGIADIRRVMEDGYSTSGGLGLGLPAVKRLMDEFNLSAELGQGTKVKVFKWL